MNQINYRIPSRLNAPAKILFLRLDEGIPALLIFFIGFFLMKMAIMSLVLSTGWVLLLKHLKKGHGSEYLLVMIQKLMPFSIFKNVPDASAKKWIF
jgi:conjugal transfer pilus assembly protein TraL